MSPKTPANTEDFHVGAFARHVRTGHVGQIVGAPSGTPRLMTIRVTEPEQDRGRIVAVPVAHFVRSACQHCGGNGVRCCEFGADR